MANDNDEDQGNGSNQSFEGSVMETASIGRGDLSNAPAEISGAGSPFGGDTVEATAGATSHSMDFAVGLGVSAVMGIGMTAATLLAGLEAGPAVVIGGLIGLAFGVATNPTAVGIIADAITAAGLSMTTVGLYQAMGYTFGAPAPTTTGQFIQAGDQPYDSGRGGNG